MSGLRYAWGFLTRLPGGITPAGSRRLGIEAPWLPVAGGFFGAAIGLLFWAASAVLPAWVAAPVAIGASIFVRRDVPSDRREFAGLLVVSMPKVVALATFSGADGLLALVMANVVAQALGIAALLASRNASPIPLDRRAAWASVALAAAALAEGGQAGAAALGTGVLATGGVVLVSRRTKASSDREAAAVGHAAEIAILVALAWFVPDYGWSWR